MKNTLRWRIPGQEFEDGSKLADWKKIDNSPWHLQFESSYEMIFDIYQHDGHRYTAVKRRCNGDWCSPVNIGSFIKVVG